MCRDACGITPVTMSKYIVTGGVDGVVYGVSRVTQYSVTGEATELPDLITGRYTHACSSFINNEGVEVREWASLDGIKNVLIYVFIIFCTF